MNIQGFSPVSRSSVRFGNQVNVAENVKKLQAELKTAGCDVDAEWIETSGNDIVLQLPYPSPLHSQVSKTLRDLAGKPDSQLLFDPGTPVGEGAQYAYLGSKVSVGIAIQGCFPFG